MPKQLSDAEAYLDRYDDLQLWDSDSGEDGLHTGEGKWSKQIGRSSEGMEKGWVGEMNRMYGTENTDMNQFSKDQYAKAHYELHGKNEGRTWGNTETPSEPTPVVLSDRAAEAIAGTKAYEDVMLPRQGDYVIKNDQSVVSDFNDQFKLNLAKAKVPQPQEPAVLQNAEVKQSEAMNQ